MSETDKQGAPSRVERLQQYGALSWSALGIIALIVVAALALGAISGVVIPLVVAVIFGIVLEPLCRALQVRGVKPTLAAAISLLTFLLGSAAVGWLVVRGILQQVPEISKQLERGWRALLSWMREHDYANLEQLRGSMSMKKCPNPEGLIRANYMKALTSYTPSV